MFSDDFLENVYETVWAIAASRYCSEYIIGYTHLANRRRKAYARNGWSYFVILADNLTQSEALRFEKRLQERIKSDLTHICFKKYNVKRRSLRHYPSSGGKIDTQGSHHSVYMVFHEEDRET